MGGGGQYGLWYLFTSKIIAVVIAVLVWSIHPIDVFKLSVMWSKFKYTCSWKDPEPVGEQSNKQYHEHQGAIKTSLGQCCGKILIRVWL